MDQKLNYYQLEQVDMMHPGQTRSIIRIRQKGHLPGEQFIQEVAKRCQLHRGTVQTVLLSVVDELLEYLPQGYSVEFPDLGTFSIGVRRVLEETEDGEKPQQPAGGTPLPHHGIKLEVSRINYATNKRFFKCVHSNFSTIDLTRIYGAKGVRILRSPYPQVKNRMIVAREYLQEHGFMKVADYARITKLSYSSAQRELRKYCDEPEYGITCKGSGSHRIYVLAPSTEPNTGV